jgi:hypothetical protein
MNRAAGLASAAVLAATTAIAQDAIILASGETIKGRVLRFDDNRFSMLVSNDVRDLPVADVRSIFFGIDDQPAPSAPSQPPPPEPVLETFVTLPPATAPTHAPAPAPPVAKTNAPATQGRRDGGPLEGGFTVSEVLARGAQLDGKLIKLEFYSRGVIREGGEYPYMTALNDGRATLDIPFPKDAYSWFSQLPDRITYSDVMGRNPRAYFVYGIVGQGTQQVFFAGRMIPGVTFEPIGRKTKKGVKGTEYTW